MVVLYRTLRFAFENRSRDDLRAKVCITGHRCFNSCAICVIATAIVATFEDESALLLLLGRVLGGSKTSQKLKVGPKSFVKESERSIPLLRRVWLVTRA